MLSPGNCTQKVWKFKEEKHRQHLELLVFGAGFFSEMKHSLSQGSRRTTANIQFGYHKDFKLGRSHGALCCGPGVWTPPVPPSSLLQLPPAQSPSLVSSQPLQHRLQADDFPQCTPILYATSQTFACFRWLRFICRDLSLWHSKLV